MKFKYKLDGDSGFLKIYELNNIEYIKLYRRSKHARIININIYYEVVDYYIYMLTDSHIAYIKCTSSIKNIHQKLHFIYEDDRIILDTSPFHGESIEVFKLNNGVLKL